jgi:hypothetical protein
MNTIETTPEPLPVVVSEKKCPTHSFNFVSVPREAGGESFGYVLKCPLKTCFHGE